MLFALKASHAMNLVPIELQHAHVMKRIRKFYERLIGSECEVQLFVVSKTSIRGWYYVHRLNSCDFYEVNIRKEN